MNTTLTTREIEILLSVLQHQSPIKASKTEFCINLCYEEYEFCYWIKECRVVGRYCGKSDSGGFATDDERVINKIKVMYDIYQMCQDKDYETQWCIDFMEKYGL